MVAVRYQQSLLAVLLFLAILGWREANAQDGLKVETVPNFSHVASVHSAVFSPVGTHVVSGSQDQTIKLWDPATGALVRTYEGHSGAVNSVAFSPDGTRLLSGSADRTVKLWDAATGHVARTLTGHSDEVTSVAFLPDGIHVVSASKDKTLILWDATTGQPVRTFKGHYDRITSVAVSTSGTRALSGSTDRSMKLWDLATGALVRTFEGHSEGITAVAFYPDGIQAVSGSHDNTMKVWDLSSDTAVRTFEGHSDSVTSVAVSSDGSRVLSGSHDQTMMLWDVATGKSARIFNADDWILSATFSPDGTLILASGPIDKLTLWDAATGAFIRGFAWHFRQVFSVTFSTDDTLLVADQRINLWNPATGTFIRSFEEHATIWSAAFSPDGSRVLSGDDKVMKLWDPATGTLLHTFEGHTDKVRVVAFSPDGSRVLSGGNDKTLKLWDTASGALLRTFEGHSDFVFCAAFTSDGTRLVSGGADGTVRLWDIATGTVTRTFEARSAVWTVTFSNDGSHVISAGGGHEDKVYPITVWDVVTGRVIQTLEGHSYVVKWVALSPDGNRLVSGSWDKTIKLWDAATGVLLRTFEGHFDWVHSVAFSRNGRRIVSGSRDSTTRIWDAETGALLATLIHGGPGQWLAMTPKGFFTASRAGTEMLGVVRGLDAYSVMQFYDHLHRPDLVEEMLKDDPESKHKDAARRINLERALDSGPAPRIELLPDRTEKRGETVKLVARIIDEGGGIGPKVIWRVNGKTQGATTAPGLGGLVSPGRYVAMQQTLTVDPTKKNEVEIIAYNGKGLLATPPLRFSIDAWGVATQERSRLFVLAVGVDKYAKADWQLRYAVKDADAFAAALKAVGSSLFGEPKITTLLDTEVTEGRMAAEFERLSSIVKARDVFVLFLGGHGRSIAGEGWFYLPQDLRLDKGHSIEKNGIGQDKWQKWMAKIPAQKSLTILDACESGANEAFRGGDRERETVMAQLEYATGRNIIAAAPAGKAAYEGYKNHGLLTYALLEALHRQDGGEADTVDVYGLAAHVSRQVPIISQREFGIRQQPRFTPTGDNFPIGIRAAVLKKVVETKPAAALQTLTVRTHPTDDSAVVETLPRGVQVRIKRVEGPWSLIERNDKEIGYVPSDALLELERN